MPFAPLTVVVGENNAGKTTVVEALRLLAMVTLRYRNLAFKAPPRDAGIPHRMGVSPSLKHVEINFETIFNQYGDPPGRIIASFGNGTSVTIYVLARRRIHAVIQNARGKTVCNKQQANNIELPAVRIMPQVAPLQRKEVVLSGDYVRANMFSRLAPLHFRNQLRVNYELYEDFTEMVETTWPGVRIEEFIGPKRIMREELYLNIRNVDFVAEAAEMGHGLQMWLQTMWFLTLSRGTSTVILDEPDVYMHADLQRRLIRLLRNLHHQTIVTTHSVEIISEVQPDEILVVDRRRQESRFAGSVPAVQAVVDRFGSVHNLHLTRLLSANRMIMVEGKDLKILKEFQDTLFPGSDAAFQSLPNMSIGGRSGWKLAIGTSLGFRKALGKDIVAYCILDSDYHSQEEIDARYKEAEQNGVQLHIWQWKEVENYLLVSAAISRVIGARALKRVKPPTAEEVNEKMKCLADHLEDTILDAMATEFFNDNRSRDLSGANKAARKRIKAVRKAHGHIISLASGKQVLSGLSEWSKDEFDVSFSPAHIAREIRKDEISSEMVSVITAIEQGEHFTLPPPK